MTIAPGTIALRLEGYDAPGKDCPAPDGVGLGIQEGREVVGVLMSSEPAPRFRGHLQVTSTDDGFKLGGPFVHGPAGDKFLYLAWIHLKSREAMARMKFRLADIDPALIRQVHDDGGVLVGKVALTNAQGKPASGSIRPPQIIWTVQSE
ncbi:MAG TPA: DUF5990 family protein [Thermomicrobiales bacterium]|nr:DUF5990 family protein [Thermomicrobiales bacterium]